MNGQAELTAWQEQELKDSYARLLRLADTVEVPGVLAAVRSALAELHAALEGQALEFAFHSRDWA
ncbi:hypothetical protein EES41_40570 (plasmid) [Streptomyces sp. ADI95-16]|uniref:DUF6052 family protein n=1 Tax=unclassified Streptomyces TaxID=2593676 RepID=UPI000F3A9A3D|nr:MULTISPECIES: DUF6052 family protein [unclassified Streptomyces]AYV33072.1 hypothetical protein EES41_40570 [Streptomyces sp. ADI95-16]RPK24625.1 hypothetical protein EES37_37320 [Streptomyces sp. ADI91-18]